MCVHVRVCVCACVCKRREQLVRVVTFRSWRRRRLKRVMYDRDISDQSGLSYRKRGQFYRRHQYTCAATEGNKETFFVVVEWKSVAQTKTNVAYIRECVCKCCCWTKKRRVKRNKHTRKRNGDRDEEGLLCVCLWTTTFKYMNDVQSACVSGFSRSLSLRGPRCVSRLK